MRALISASVACLKRCSRWQSCVNVFVEGKESVCLEVYFDKVCNEGGREETLSVKKYGMHVCD